MEKIDTQAVMANQAILLRTVAQALTLDLAVAPLILASDHGIGANAQLKAICEGLGMQFSDIRCISFHGQDFLPVARTLEEGEQTETAMIDNWLDGFFADARPSLILLDEAIVNGVGVTVGILGRIAEKAKSPVVVALRGYLQDEQQMLTAISEGLGIHRAHVPTARLSLSRTVEQPILLVGNCGHDGSKCGERYFEITTYEPHEADIRFTVMALPGQDDDDLNADLDAVWNGNAAVRLEYLDGHLVCNAADMEALA